VVNVDRTFFNRINFDRELFRRLKIDRELLSRFKIDRKVLSRINLPAAGAAAAFAMLVGLSAPAAALTDAGSVAATTAEPPAAAVAAAEAMTNTVAPAAPQAPVAPAPAPAPALPPGLTAPAPSAAQLHPVPPAGPQQVFTPTAEQVSNAKAIVQAGQAMGLPPRAWIIAVATSLQESNLRNLGDLGAGNDHDSLGLFQQRPSSGWGSPAEITNPIYSATAFYKGLIQVAGWDSMPLTSAAQKVQVSAYPDHYAKHEAQAEAIIAALYGAGPYAGIAATV
jgi:hypothetical protein